MAEVDTHRCVDGCCKCHPSNISPVQNTCKMYTPHAEVRYIIYTHINSLRARDLVRGLRGGAGIKLLALIPRGIYPVHGGSNRAGAMGICIAFSRSTLRAWTMYIHHFLQYRYSTKVKLNVIYFKAPNWPQTRFYQKNYKHSHKWGQSACWLRIASSKCWISNVELI